VTDTGPERDGPRPPAATSPNGPWPRVTAQPDGPVEIHGDLTIAVPGRDEPVRMTRAVLCRCGHSSNKPFCDDSHLRVGFEGGGLQELPVRATERPEGEPGALRIRPRENGSLFVEGWVHLETEDGRGGWIENVSLCRCGLSGRRPLCDSSHKESDFVAPGAE